MELFDNTSLPGIISLLVFFLFFVGIIAWVFRPGSKDRYREAGDIPLKEDN